MEFELHDATPSPVSFAVLMMPVPLASFCRAQSHPQGRLKPEIDLLSKAFPFWPRVFDDGREPKRKRVLFLPPDLDYRANCFCKQKWPGECQRCSTLIDYDLGYIDLEQTTLQPLDDPFAPR